MGAEITRMSSRWLLARKLMLSTAFLAVSTGYVWWQGGRTPPALVAASEPAVPDGAVLRDFRGNQITVQDGVFEGGRYDARFGYIRVAVTFAGNKLIAVQTTEFPDHSLTSTKINEDALPKLEQEAIMAQAGDVDAVSGATLTSRAWEKSVKQAIRKAAR